MKTIMVAGKRVPLTNLGKENGVEVMTAQLELKGLGKVTVRVEKADPAKYKALVEFLEVPRTALEIQKKFDLKTWSAAGRLIDAAKVAGVQVFVRKDPRPFLFSSKPIDPAVNLKSPKANLEGVLHRMMERLEALEQRSAAHPSPPLSAPNLPPPSH